MLKQLKIHNFRTYLNAEVDFSKRHLVIGRNNSGKTNLCRALRFLASTSMSDLSESAGIWIPGGISEMKNSLFSGEQVSFSISCELPFDQQQLSYQYDLVLEASVGNGSVPGALSLKVVSEKLHVQGGDFKNDCLLNNDGRESVMLHEEHVGSAHQPHTPKTLSPPNATMLSKLFELENNRRAILFRKYLSSWTYFSFSPEHIRDGWRESSRASGIHSRGDNLATAIFQLKNQDDRRYRRFIERVRLFEPELEAVSFLIAPDQGIIPFVAMAQRGDTSWVGLSDGTLRAMGLSYVIEIADRFSKQPGSFSPFMMIEEPENGIYGRFLRKIIEDAENHAPQAQFVFTSHSPFFIDLFDYKPESVTVLRREGEQTIVERLKSDKGIPPIEDRVSLSEKFFSEVFG